ncbi:MAG: DUF3137 domain-containing protein [Bacteroidetes bacterium]|nr:DUF3137 domain-containing protein [Bacteroidota bacterium]
MRVKYKPKILPKILSYLFDDFNYLPQQRIARSVIQNSRIMQFPISKIEGEDYMWFRLGETAIHFSEVQLLGDASQHGFNGIFISATFNKSFTSETVVLPNNFRLRTKKKLAQHFNDFKIVKLEDKDFNREFIVLSTDQIESRYILSTSMMARMLDYKNKTGKPVSFSFTGNLLHCAVPNALNLFEPPLFESFYNFQLFQKKLRCS